MFIKDIKKKARKSLKFHYWHAVVICFLLTIIIAGGLKYNSISPSNSNINNTISNINILEDFMSNFNIKNIYKSFTFYKPTRGVLSIFFNQISETGSLSFGILNSINQILFRNSVSSIIISSLSILIFIFNFIFIQNILIVGKNRYFLERRKYKNTPIDDIFFIYRTRKTLNVSKVMLLKNIYQLLWDFTIIGGIIKHYEYFMIPYILAENPEISTKECFQLSKKLSSNNKFNLFKIDFSLIGWYILGIFTIDLSNIFLFNPYKESIYAELYMFYRNVLLNKDTSYSTLLNDKYLDDSYGKNSPPTKHLFKNSKIEYWLKINYKVDYSISDLVLIFFNMSIVGWIWEVLFHLFSTGNFVNRGTYFGPWLPIYGWGSILILVFLKKYRDRPQHLFFLSMILCGVIEYFASVYLEMFKGLRWWDYTGYFMNIRGRICLEGLLFFALGGYIITYFLAPYLKKIFDNIPLYIKRILLIILIFFFTVDLVYSHYNPNTGDGITTVKETKIIEAR